MTKIIALVVLVVCIILIVTLELSIRDWKFWTFIMPVAVAAGVYFTL